MRLTDEELSRVLTAHEAGGLKRCGKANQPAYPACLMQTSRCYGTSTEIPLSLWSKVRWFDGNYQPSWTTEEFLAALEARGLA